MAEVAVLRLNSQLEQADNFTMTLKMKLKMRDSEIARFKKKSTGMFN
jgi:hypothetical protein